MAVNRQKADNDPLTMFMNNPDLVNEREEPEVEVLIQPVIKKQTPKVASASVSAPVVSTATNAPSNSQFTSGAPVAAAVAVAPKSKPAPAAVVKPPLPPEDDEPIFGRVPDAAVGDDLFKGVDVNKVGKGSHLLRLGNEGHDDSQMDDLKMNKLLEEENDLDYEMFGCSDVTMSGYAKVTKTAPAPKPKSDSVLDDLDLNNGIIDLDIKEPDANIFSSAVQYTTAAPEAAPVAAPGDFDINSYIKSQAEDSGGGLFD
jgi:hypothetical protein